jgi:hypothetical protein
MAEELLIQICVKSASGVNNRPELYLLDRGYDRRVSVQLVRISVRTDRASDEERFLRDGV